MNSYPTLLIPLVLAVGVIIGLARPNSLFVIAVLCLSALNQSAATLTRTPFGAFPNLADAFLIVLVSAFLFDVYRTRRRASIVPKIVGWLILVWGVGLLVGLVSAEAPYYVFREARWALSFILCIVIGYNFVRTEQQIRTFVIALFIGALLAAGQHLLLVATNFTGGASLSTSAQIGSIRYIAFLFSPINYFFVAAILLPSSYFGSWSPKLKLLWWASISIFLLSIILNQTRSVWISVLGSCVVITVLLWKRLQSMRIVLVTLAFVCIAAVVLPLLLPGLNLYDVITARYTSLADEALRYQTTITRQNQIRVELGIWYERGVFSWLLGNGFAYRWHPTMVAIYGTKIAEGGEGVAFGHIGYVTYLANLGLIGLFVYGVLTPIVGLRAGLRLYKSPIRGLAPVMGLLALASAIINPISFMMSASYLQPELYVPGLLLGASLGCVNFILPHREHAFHGNEDLAPHHHRYAII